MDYEIRLWQAIWHRNQKQLQPAIDLLQEICNANLPIRRGTIALRANFVAGTCYLEWNRPEQAYKYFKAIPLDIATLNLRFSSQKSWLVPTVSRRIQTGY